MSNYCKNCYELTEKLEAKEKEYEEFRKANDEKNELLAKLGCPTIATAKRKVFCLQQQLDQLKAKNEELKKILNEGCLHNLTLMTEQRVLLQTLDTIKEIAEKEVKRAPDGETFARPEIKQILQKINEVLNGTNS